MLVAGSDAARGGIVDFVPSSELEPQAGGHCRATCSAEIRELAFQHTKNCKPDRCGRMPLGQLGGIGLAKVESAIGERGFFQLGMEFGRDSSME